MAQRDPQAFGVLYDRYINRVGAYCLRELRNREEAEDATSATFHKALAALPRFHGASFGGWLFTIARNEIVNCRRTRWSGQPLLDEIALADPAPSPEEIALAAEADRSVEALVARLPPNQRQVVQLRRAGLTDQEIAQVLGLSHGNVRVIQHRAVQRLSALREEASRREEAANG
jgi:RNA polymerase sigma-70 factor (ECF subfamily)